MKHKFFVNISALIFLFILFSNEAFSQTGKIVGKVTDKTTGETLIGLTVGIDGTTKGAATDIEGRYQIVNLASGKYNISFRYLGYQTKNVTEVEVVAGQTTNLEVIMEQTTAQTLQEVVITATYRQETVGALYAQQKNSAVISDGISSEVIKKSPDRNAGEILKRVSGTTIQDNKFVVIRGLSDRYNTAQLDGSPLPSTEPNRKAFSFDIVPAILIDNIIISKTATPDLPGDFAGGAIQILTKDIPDQNFLTVGLGFGYNSQTTFKDFRSGYRNISDYFGFDNGARALPKNFPSTENVINGLGNQTIPTINSLNNNYGLVKYSALPTQNYQITMGRVKDVGKNKNQFGSTYSLSYRNSETTTPEVRRNYFVYDYTDNQYRFSTNIGALANFAYKYGNSKITFKNLYNRIFEDLFTFRTGSNVATTSNDNRFYGFDLTQKGLLKSTLEGDHRIGSKKARIKWNLGFNNVINNQPDQRKVNYVQNSVGGPYAASVTTLGKDNTRFFSSLKENIFSGGVSYSKPIKFLGTSNLKVGLSSIYRDRVFDARFIGLLINSNLSGSEDIRQRPIKDLFGQDVIKNGLYRLDEIANFTDRYTANNFTNSMYGMLDSKLSEKLRAVYGVRIEKFDLSLSSKDLGQPQPQAQLNNLDILPSLNLTYSLTAKSNFRFSYFRTLARPEFRELAPFAYYDYEILATQIGNPNLKRTSIQNVDLRFETYPSVGQVFSISAFYKNFTNAIEPFIDDVNSSSTISYFNSQSAYVYGIEMEARKNLEFLGDQEWLKNTTLYSNFSFNKSDIKNPDNSFSIDANRPLVGQSPYVINAGIQYAAFSNQLNINILYNRLGRRIFSAGGRRFPSIYENSRDVMDAQIGIKAFKSKGEFKLNASDLLNQFNTFYFDYDLNKKYNTSGIDEAFKRYKNGRNISLSFNYTF